MMAAMKWFYPTSIEEAMQLLSQEEVFLHGGGTGLLRRGLQGINGLIDMSSLPFNTIKREDSTVIIGSQCTYAQASDALLQIDPENVLGKALALAASTPLRNRITIGGSLAFLPPWSDLLGPLVALDARIAVAWPQKRTFSLSEFISTFSQQNKCLITHIIVPAIKTLNFYYRETRVSFDYPSFTLTIILKISEGSIEKARIIFTGNKTRFYEAKEIEEKLLGLHINTITPEDYAQELPEIDFIDKQSGSAHYLNEISKVWLERGLRSLKEGESQ
jgi:CO/xanthine dehydrogenase FAD-binding subunit